MFIDYVEIEIIAGNGGHGCVAFHTEKFVPKGGPDGGDGGKGGNIVVVADHHLTTLLDFRYKRKHKAPNGQPGGGSLKTGKSGKDEILRLPVGTLIRDLDTNELIVDLDEKNANVVIAKGGKGGHGNAFYKSATNQTPRKAQDGFLGEKRRLGLELKLLADVGLVGLPNAGKSTILSVFSAARPKIADYPFTTLKPHLGIIKLHDFNSCVMADIPGLIEGASSGKGLGHQFLKHIQRTKVLVYVIDINEIDIENTLDVLKKELANFDESLLERPSFVAITKIDTISESDLKDISKLLNTDYIYLSAVSGKGKKTFIQEIEHKLDQQRN
ncbi:MAG: GTPase ObgE [candidate division Zixibacteria bacterium]|nr:GTPase ObgE [candidate division Zixibacteria bacterium]